MHLQHGTGVSPRTPGRMTAVMRALAAPAGSVKVLRIALLQDGRVVEDRLFREPQAITIGASEKSSFVVAGAASLRLFDLVGGDYWLALREGMTGRVATAEGTFDLATLRAQARDGRVRLGHEARGRISIGRATLLFQFVTPPPAPARPQLPISVRGGPGVDWAITIVAAFSFLVHFGVIGSMYSDWLDPIVADDAAVVSIVDMTRSLPSQTIEEQPEPAASVAPASTTPSAAPSRPSHDGRTEAERHAAALASDAEAMKMQLLAAFGGSTAVEGALRRSDSPIESLENAAASSQGASPAGNELHLAGGAVTTPGHTGLRDLGVTHGGGGGTSGTEHVVQGPRVTVTPEHFPSPPELPNPERPIALLRPSYRACYVNKGLSQNPSMAGKLVIAIRVAPNGDVADVHKVSGTGLSSEVEQCIIQRTYNADFDAPGGSGATIQVPIIFEHQQ